MERWIRAVVRAKWMVVALWVIMVVLSVTNLPDLKEIVARTETQFLPKDAEAAQARELLDRMKPDRKERSNAVVDLHRSGGLTPEDKAWLEGKWSELKTKQQEFGFASLLTAADQPEMAEKFRSADGSTELALIGYETEAYKETTKANVGKLSDWLGKAPEGAEVHLTGSAPIAKDFNESSENGLRKTELLTLVLVFGILLVVFRSPVTPFIPLLTIGLSFMLTRGLVAWATGFGLPVSSFTESFLIAVLFGAGTDYCILIIQRYREELLRGGSSVDALVRAFAGVGKTVIYSSSTVFAAFFIIGFAKFGLYQSASGVAIGVAVTLLAGLTLAPALIAIGGRGVFWPVKPQPGLGHGESRFWSRMAGLAAARPAVVLLLAMLTLLPLFTLFEGKRSFDDIAEIDPSLDSVAGFEQVRRSFGEGEVFPVTVTLSAERPFNTGEALAALEKASARVSEIEGVKEVRSAVRPLGKQVEELTVSYQLAQMNKALGGLKQGVEQVSGGLSAAGGQIPIPAVSDGLRQGETALQQVAAGLQAVQSAQQGIVQQGGKQLPGWYVPEEALTSAGMRQALDFYVSADGTITKLDVVLDRNPYSPEAMNLAGRIKDAVKESLHGTVVADADVKLAGTTAQYKELREISKDDFVRTGGLMLAGVFLVLVLLLRSWAAPVYLLLSLVINYLATMGLVEFFFVKILGYPGLSWTVSFFIFLITIALGVDYSIFLMARFREEYRTGGAAEAMRRALATTGGVILSAAVIMGGTFAALMYSGVVTLVQVGAGVLVGLLLYSTVFMGLVVPALATLFGEWNVRLVAGASRSQARQESVPQPKPHKLILTEDSGNAL